MVAKKIYARGFRFALAIVLALFTIGPQKVNAEYATVASGSFSQNFDLAVKKTSEDFKVGSRSHVGSQNFQKDICLKSSNANQTDDINSCDLWISFSVLFEPSVPVIPKIDWGQHIITTLDSRARAIMPKSPKI